MSAIWPPGMHRALDPKTPVKKRRMIRVQTFCEPQQPAVKAVYPANESRKMLRRPTDSEIGAQSNGPMAYPRTMRDRPRMMTSWLHWNSAINGPTVPE